jgi:hypothetical protein
MVRQELRVSKTKPTWIEYLVVQAIVGGEEFLRVPLVLAA